MLGFEPKQKESESFMLPLHHIPWWLGTESNRRHTDFQSVALPTELSDHIWQGYQDLNLG